MKKNELVVFLLIVVVAATFRFYHLDITPPGLYPDEAMNGNNAIQALETNDFKVFYPENNGREGLFIFLQAISIKIFGNTSWALRGVSALFGTLTVIGLYFLVRLLFNRYLAAAASFLLAVSFWHVNFSRIGFRAIMAPFFIVWGLYFFWKGLASGKISMFVTSGLMWGLGMYTYIAFRAMPLVLIITVLAYWHTIKRDFDHHRYVEARIQLIRGIAMLFLVMFAVSLPLLFHFYDHPEDFLGRASQVSIFSSATPLKDLATNIVKTFGMFIYSGDWNWRHNYAGSPVLLWPVAALFAIGFLGSILKLGKSWRRHGHVSSVQTLLLSWFFVAMLPVVISDEGIPHALRSIMLAPVAMIFATEGLWWLFTFLEHRQQRQDLREVNVPMPFHHRIRMRESALISVTVMVIFLASIGFVEFNRYFNDWAKRPEVQDAFSARYKEVANQLMKLPQSKIKYVLVNADGVLVNGIP
ncbi:MAG: glycosyltransferase family 39 protein, partial [Candidatus Yanofskybacteria bacterium]|nr:glycosyltransferase family 39 protein [Candidatus Yanofskybacteria bacterium]